jgi:phosphoglycolate phosphatase
MTLAWLFDIDGTLLTTDGAARESFSAAVAGVLGAEDDLQDIAFAGRTETSIIADILRKHGRSFAEGEEARFWNAVYSHMRAALRPGRGRLLPGVPELLEAVALEPGWVMGLLTGNRSEMARIKLEHYGIFDRFGFGGFGEETAHRNDLAKIVIERVRARHGLPPDRCIVIGDTEHDVACARAAGAHVVAVATGLRRREDLAPLKPDLLLDDLSDREGLIAWARGLGSEGRS